LINYHYSMMREQALAPISAQHLSFRKLKEDDLEVTR
jgi:hypothetical protein